jgi:hypothetical protein
MTRFVGMCLRSVTLPVLLFAVLAIGQRTGSVEAAQPPAAQPAPAAAPAATTHTYVGTPAGVETTARIGIVCDEKNFLVYVCSQDATFNNDHAAWFKGERNGNTIEASAAGRTLKATVAADAVTGEIKSGGATIAFAAKACDDHVCAGLYRAEDAADGATVVFGWVVDEDGNVAGGRQRQGAKGTGVIPNNGVLNGLNGRANAKAQPVNGQRVQNPARPPVGAKKKFTPERRQEFLDRMVAKSPKDGNPLMAMMMHMVKRFNNGEKPQGAVEEAAFAKLRTLPRQALVDYVKNFESLPQATRDRILGNHMNGVTLKQPVTQDMARTLVSRAGIKSRAAAAPVPAAAAPRITKVTVKELKCFKTTSSAGEFRDEIFAVYAVASANVLFAKTTGQISGIRNGDENNFAAADQIVFPPADQPGLTSAEDVFVVAKLFEADGNINLIRNTLKVLADTAIVIVAVVLKNPAIGGFVVPANLLIDQITAGLPDAQPLGEDAFRATLDGKTKKVDSNTNVNELEFKRNDRAGPAPFDYRLRQLDVKN